MHPVLRKQREGSKEWLVPRKCLCNFSLLPANEFPSCDEQRPGGREGGESGAEATPVLFSCLLRRIPLVLSIASIICFLLCSHSLSLFSQPDVPVSAHWDPLWAGDGRHEYSMNISLLPHLLGCLKNTRLPDSNYILFADGTQVKDMCRCSSTVILIALRQFLQYKFLVSIRGIRISSGSLLWRKVCLFPCFFNSFWLYFSKDSPCVLYSLKVKPVEVSLRTLWQFGLRCTLFPSVLLPVFAVTTKKPRLFRGCNTCRFFLREKKGTWRILWGISWQMLLFLD